MTLQGRLYGRGPCAQRLPRKLRLLLFGSTHQEIDMMCAFYEIMRRLSQDEQLPTIGGLRSALTQLLGMLPHENLPGMVKRHPLIVMNAGTGEACAYIERRFGLPCPAGLLHLSRNIERATRQLVQLQLPS